MSELKAFDITVAEEGYFEGIVKYRRAVYDKSEADKVIAHNKFKRCLAMANMCQEAICYWDNVKYTYFKGEAYCFRKLNHYGRWGQIWLAISEKFKEER